MRSRLLGVIAVAALVLATAGLLRTARVPDEERTPLSVSSPGPAPSTPWGEPDLQGIWTDPYQTPLERPAQFVGKQVFTDEERAALDKQRAALPRRDRRLERGTERDVAGAYNSVFQSVRPTGKRTSLVVDPPDGRIPALTPEAAKRSQTESEYRLAMLEATETCKKKEPACSGGKYGPPSPKRAAMPPFYNTGRLNRNDGPEDRSMTVRCMGALLPDFGGYRRIVQSPGSVSILYDAGQGQGWERVIPMTGRPHRNTIEYSVTIDDPATWIRPWTVKQELIRQDEPANRIYYEPRCHEGNFGLPTMLLGARAEERAFQRGERPDPATKDTATDFGNEGGGDALPGNGGAIF